MRDTKIKHMFPVPKEWKLDEKANDNLIYFFVPGFLSPPLMLRFSPSFKKRFKWCLFNETSPSSEFPEYILILSVSVLSPILGCKLPHNMLDI